MASLKLRRRGRLIQTFDLSENQIYVAGRGASCQILLEGEKGISREHFKLFFESGNWIVEVISKIGEVSLGGERVDRFTLEDKMSFSVPPFEFEFTLISNSAKENFAQSSASPSQLPSKISNFDAGAAAKIEPEFNDEKTFIGFNHQLIQISFLTPGSSSLDQVILEGDGPWLAGREPSCHIFIRKSKVSRRQFEIRRNGAKGFFIVDLGSANGTKLRGESIPKDTPLPLNSGDEISVLDIRMRFEIVDPQFANKIQSFQSNLPAISNQTLSYFPTASTAIGTQTGGLPQEYMGQTPSNYYPQMQMPGPIVANENFLQKNKIRIAIGCAIVLLLYLVFSSPDNTNKTNKQITMANDPYEKLSKEQKQLVKQSHQLAKNYLMQGKYELAQSEILKMKEIIPEYEDSHEVERLAVEGLQLLEEKRRNDMVEQAKKDQEEKIISQTNVCSKLLTNPNINSVEMDSCLSSVIEYNPEHPKILDLKQKVEQITLNRKIQEDSRKEYAAKAARLAALFDKAKGFEAEHQPLIAIEQYERVIQSDLPDPDGLKTQARGRIKLLRGGITEKTAKLLQAADQQAGNNQYKIAILNLRRALKLDPENEAIRGKIDQFVLELRKQMMLLFQEGIIEESYGNVDGSEGKPGAKDKWKKILEFDIPDGEYYQKARIKLKKYGAI